MIVLACNQITKSFGVDIILNQITFSVNAGYCIGVVGGNGAGKSTLFKIITGLLDQDSGEVYKAKDTSIAYLPQDTVLESNKTIWDELIQIFTPIIELEQVLRDMENQMVHYDSMDEKEYSKLMDEYSKLQESFEEQDGYSYQSYIRGVLIGLGFSSEDFYKPIEHLSGGQKTRVALAKVLLEKPNLLLLDEPTNHLDLDAMQWLEEYLSVYPGTIMIISHDRYFLDSLCDNILEIENNQSHMFPGNYSLYQEKKSEWLALREKEYNSQQKEITRQENIIERYRSFNREKSIRAAESRQKKLDKMDRVDQVQGVDEVDFDFDIKRQSGREVLKVESLSKAFGSNSLFRDISFDIRLGDRVAIIGPNGCGKSTLFNIILDKLPPSSGSIKVGTGVEIGYYDQELTSLNEENTVLEELWDAFPQMTETQIRNALAARLFRGDDVYKSVSSLSGGEKGHLVLTKLVLSKNNFLLLDEPTNHLDMASREELEQALTEYPGTILMVSHDRYFLNKMVDRIIVMESESINEYLGNYDDYIDKRKALLDLSNLREEKNRSASASTRTAMKDERRRERLEREEEKRHKEILSELEVQIHRVEDKIKTLENQMSDPSLYDDINEMLKVQEKYAQLKKKLEGLYSEWMGLVN